MSVCMLLTVQIDVVILATPTESRNAVNQMVSDTSGHS